jgi:hypothetical protein
MEEVDCIAQFFLADDRGGTDVVQEIQMAERLHHIAQFFLVNNGGGTDGVQEIQVAEKLRWHSGYVSFAPLSGFFILVRTVIFSIIGNHYNLFEISRQ